MENKIRNQYKKTKVAHSKYESECGQLEQLIQDKLNPEDVEEGFDIRIIWQQADGFVVQFQMGNAPLIECIKVIEKNGCLSMEDFFNITI